MLTIRRLMSELRDYPNDTRIDFIIALESDGTVYKVTTVFVVKSNLAFLYILAIYPPKNHTCLSLSSLWSFG